MDKVDALLESIGEMNADIEDLVESKSEDYRTRFLELLNTPGERDPDLWDNAGADTENEISAYFEVVPDNRDDLWRSSVSSMIAAARIQALYETGIFHDLIEMSERNGEIVSSHSRKMSRSDLKSAVAKLPGSGVTDAAKAKRKIGR